MEKNKEAVHQMTFKDLLFTGIGLTIGAGVVSTVGPAIGATGRSAWLAYMVAIVVGAFTVFPMLMFASTFRVKGGVYTCLRNTLGDNVAGIYICMNILMGLNFATFSIASGAYIQSLIPGANPQVVAVIVLVAFYLLNIRGLDVFVKTQTYMSYLLLTALVIFGICGMVQLDPAVFQFTSPEFMPNGGAGFIQAVTMFMFSTIAYSVLLNFSGNSKNPKRDIPRAMFGTIIVIAIVYFLVSVAACGVLPPEEMAGQMLTVAAQKMWPGIGVTLFVVAGPLMALFTTLNGNFANMAAPHLSAAQDGWWPKAMAKTNRWGSPYVVYTVCFLIALFPIVLNYSVSEIVGNMVIIFQVNTLFASIACYVIPTKYPEAWAKSSLHMPKPVFYVLNVISTIAVLYAAYVQIGTLRPVVLLVTFVGYAIVIGFTQYRRKKGYVHMKDKVEFE